MKLPALLLALVLVGCTANPPVPPPDTTQLPDVILPGDTVQLPDVIIPGEITRLPDVEIPGDTVQLPDIILPGDTIPSGDPLVCRDGWVCTEIPPEPPVEVDSIPPLSVSGLTLTLTGAEVLVEWNDRPNPDRGGVSTEGYYVASGNDTTGEPNPTVDVAGTPHRITLTAPGKHYICVTPHNPAGIPESTCGNVVYQLPDAPLACDGDAHSSKPFKLVGPIFHGDSTVSVQLHAIPVPSPGCDGFAGITRPLSDYRATLAGVVGTTLPDLTGWWWEDAPRDGTISVVNTVEPIDDFTPWGITYIEVPLDQ